MQINVPPRKDILGSRLVRTTPGKRTIGIVMDACYIPPEGAQAHVQGDWKLLVRIEPGNGDDVRYYDFEIWSIPEHRQEAKGQRGEQIHWIHSDVSAEDISSLGIGDTDAFSLMSDFALNGGDREKWGVGDKANWKKGVR